MTELNVTAPHAFSVRAVPTNPVPVTTNGAAVILVPVPGGQGDPGPPGEGTQILGESPTGARDGINTTFTTAHAFITASTAVYLNGLREFAGEGYTETSSTTIAFSDPPLSTDNVRIDYLMA